MAEDSFGRWIHRRRRALDLTQDELARQVFCSVSAIRKLEADERRPSKPIAARLAIALQIAPEDHAAFITFARTEPYLNISPPPLVPSELPPLSLPPRRSATLPTPLTRLIGRDQDVAAARNALLRDDTRLLTLIGPPGIGKTRLSLAVAHDVQAAFSDGASFVALAPISDPALVFATIAQALGIKESAGQPLLDQLVAALQDQRRLLVLDNFEQVLAAAALVAALLEGCPGVKALITSRAALHVRGEQLYPVPALLLPNLTRLPTPSALAHTPAVVLFVERALAVLPAFQLTAQNAVVVAAICVRLDGLPLAIELAAARMTLLTPDAILCRLSNALGLLTGGARDVPARQQTLRNTIDWSYTLLSVQEQLLFRRLAVFVDSWTLEAAEAICRTEDEPIDVLETLQTLVDHSLLHQEAGSAGVPRFRMLETLRAYAREQLEATEEAASVGQRHAVYYLMLAETVEPLAQTAEQGRWHNRREAEYNNIRAALYWFTAHQATTYGWADNLYMFTVPPRASEQAPAAELVLKTYAPNAGGRAHAAREWHALTHLHAVNYPVPRVNLFEPDDHHFGSPFIVMEHVPGTPLWQVYETADQATQDRLTQVFVAQLLALHTLDPQLLAPETTLAQPYEFIEHELDQLRIDSQHSPHTTLMEIVQWLEQRKATVPCVRPAILHRDYHPWNVLIDTAERAWVIDWDWQIGDARFDLAWTLMLMRRSGFDAFSTAVHDHYAGQSDRSLDALAYFEVLTTVRWLLNVTYAVESEAMPPAATADFRRFLIEPVRHAEAFLQERTGVAVAISL